MPRSTLDIITDPVTGNKYARDPSIAGSTYAPYTEPQETMPIPKADPLKDFARRAGASGVSLDDFQKLIPSQTQSDPRDAEAKKFGYNSYDDFVQEIFAKPSKTTQQVYEQAYRVAGLDKLLKDIKAKQERLIEAASGPQENPWYTEATRSGKLGRLQELAQPDIKNHIDLYKLGLEKVNALVQNHTQDFTNDNVLNEARLSYLLKAAEEKASTERATTLSQYLGDYLSGKQPETVNADGVLYRWDPNEQEFVQVSSPTRDGFTLSEGQTRYDANGNIIASAGGATNPGAGIVGGYDIGRYATDPQHEANVAAIYSRIGDVSTAAKADAYIRSIAPKSPITGGMVVNAAKQYGIDPGMLIAMMLQDSSLGTVGKGARTFNPGNVGNDDEGNIRNYGSWQAGVNAVAEWLAKAKVAGNSAFVQAAQNVQAGLTKDQRAAFNQNLAAAMAQDPTQAKNLIITTAIRSLTADQQNKAFGRITAIDELDRIEKLLTDYQAAGGNTGILTGTEEQIAQKLGSTTDPELAEIGNAIMTSIIAYRNAVSGAAFTESEAKVYDQLFPSASKSFKLNTAKLKSLRDAFNNQQRSALATVLGSYETYDELQKATRAGQVVTVQGKAYRVAPDGDTLIPLFSQYTP